MAFHHDPLLRMPTIDTEAYVVSMLWCMFVLFGVLLACYPYFYDLKEGSEDYTNTRIFVWNIQSLAKLLLSGVASSTKHRWPLSCYPVQLPNPLYHASSFLHLMNLESRKCGGVKIFFIFLSSLSESRDEIPVKWGSLSHPKISDFGLCIENTK